LLIVSISGFSEQTYARNHVGGDFKLVRRNLESLKNQGAAIKEIVVKYLVFNYNRDELELARSFCKEHGFQFGAYAGAIPCVESFFRYIDDCDYRRKVEEFLALEQINLQSARFCPEETTITLNHKAELEQCCVSWNSGYGLSVFDADIREYLDRKAENEFCGKCLSSGFSHYKHFGTMSPLMLSAALYPSLAAQRSYTKTDLDEKMSLLSE